MRFAGAAADERAELQLVLHPHRELLLEPEDHLLQHLVDVEDAARRLPAVMDAGGPRQRGGSARAAVCKWPLGWRRRIGRLQLLDDAQHEHVRAT